MAPTLPPPYMLHLPPSIPTPQRRHVLRLRHAHPRRRLHPRRPALRAVPGGGPGRALLPRCVDPAGHADCAAAGGVLRAAAQDTHPAVAVTGDGGWGSRCTSRDCQGRKGCTECSGSRCEGGWGSRCTGRDCQGRKGCVVLGQLLWRGEGVPGALVVAVEGSRGVELRVWFGASVCCGWLSVFESVQMV